jgi:hypothetical protein
VLAERTGATRNVYCLRLSDLRGSGRDKEDDDEKDTVLGAEIRLGHDSGHDGDDRAGNLRR